jgi:hypothetical protein
MSGDCASLGPALATFAGQAAIVAAGWLVVHRQAVRRDLEKSKRDLITGEIDQLLDLVDELLRLSVSYHTCEARTISTEDEVKLKLQDLGHRVGDLGRVVADTGSIGVCRTKSIQFKRACTGHHFEDEHAGPLARDSQQIQEIAATALALKRALAQVKLAQFVQTGNAVR